MREALALPVDDEIDRALSIEVDVLGAMPAFEAEAQPLDQRRKLPLVDVADRKFDELDAFDVRRGGQFRQVGQRRVAARRAGLVQGFAERAQRAHAVEGDGVGGGAAKLIVEDFQGHRPAIAGLRDRVEIVDDSIVALAGIAAIVPAQRERVHLDLRRVRHLHQRDAIGGDRAHRRNRIAAHASVEAVEDDAEIRSIGHAHDIPGGGPILDVPSPRQGLVADGEPMLARAVGEFGEIFGGPRGVVDGVFRDIGAKAEQPGAEFVHDVELARRTFEIARPDRLRHRLEVAHRLKRDDLQPEVGGHPPGVARAAAEEGQVVLE